jgi:hypothetical protein
LCDTEEGKLLAHCFGGCEYDDILSALVEYGLLDDGDYVESCDVSLAIKPNANDESQRIDTARWIYDRLAPAAGSIATYLRSRHITIKVPSILRFGSCPHRASAALLPAMAAPVVDVGGNRTGVHMTYLRADGNGKAFDQPGLCRECRGVVRGGAIRLAPHNPDCELIVAEGIESGLSASEIFGLPAWSAVSAGGLKTLKLPPTVRGIVIAADNDISGAGQRAALAAYERWSGEGRTVRVKIPPGTGDFNDVLIRRGK